MKKLKVTVEVGFEDIGKDSNIESAKLDLRSGLKELMFETASEYANITAFNIKEIVLDTNGVDSEH
jgi:hypothetical protein